ncbi:MAG: carbon monoxide dehydrogenase [Opitutaceae bacterium]|nr:carbon monoxide dehydrogenase [Opitutaceae bacterium]
MTIQGTHRIAALPQLVFDRLIDPAVLQQAITGCEKLEKTGADEYIAHLRLGIASIKGSYTGKVKLTDQEPPHKFTLHIDGKGGPGFVKGISTIELREEDGATNLQYSAEVQVGGLIAAVGSRMIEAAAKKMAAEFFHKFAAMVGGAGKPAR